MWAQYRFLRVNGGSDVDEFFVVASEDRSDTQQATLWNPEEGDAILAFGNVTDLPTSAVVKLSNGGLRNISLAPRATQILSFKNQSGNAHPESTVTEGTATGGFLEDDHTTPGTFVKPYQAKTITAAQIYRYRCTCKQNNAWITVLDGLSIERSVSQNANGSWKFTITKSGQTATINPLP